MAEKQELNHFDEKGRAVMVDVSQKGATVRTAVAKGRIRMRPETLAVIRKGDSRKGDVLGVARVAGIMGAKKTAELVPLCHPIFLEHCAVTFEIDEERCEVEATCSAQTAGKTGVEMEALTGASTALLTIYDMCKAMDRAMEIHSLCLHTKTGGKSGDFHRNGEAT